MEPVALYQPLDSHGEEIRLVTLQQGQFHDAIHCHLSKVSLKEGPSYQALSYTWGQPNSTLEIYLNKRPHQVTTNLEAALRRLRLATTPRALWIDALCINQTDILERNSQVMHMNGIYRKASKVVVWLGEEAENSNLAFNAFNMLPKIESLHWDLVADPALEKALRDPKYALATEKLFQRSWWHRVWTIQESILGRRIEFVCGTQQISADKLFAVQRSFHKHMSSCCQSLMNLFSHTYRYNQPMAMLDLLSGSRSYQKTAKIDMLLARYRFHCCTDPRDKIYGLLGITEGMEANLIVPDYSSPVPIVYENLALKLIESSQSLNIFSQIFPGSLKKDGIATNWLPSWVPDWTAEGNHAQMVTLNNRSTYLGFYSASAETSAHVKLVAHGKIALRGILLDSCDLLGEPNNSKSAYDFRILRGWEDLVDNKLSLLYNNSDSTTYYDAYWQTICASLVSQTPGFVPFRTDVRTSDDSPQRSWHDDWWASYKKTHNHVQDKRQIEPEAKVMGITAFAQLVANSTISRRLFISKENGLLGLAPMDAKVGDRISLLEGGSVPYILRPKAGRENEWQIIGGAYVHGIMDGEAWEPNQLVDIVLV